MVLLSFTLSITATNFLREKLRGQSVLAVERHSSMHMWVVPHNKLLKDYYQKRTETGLQKDF